MKALVLLIFSALLLTGCSSYIQVADGYATAVANSAQAAEDLNLKAIKFSLCATPYSAIIRNPEFAAAIKELCAGKTGTASESLLDIEK